MTDMRHPEAEASHPATDPAADPISRMSEILMAQSLTLDTMFAELAKLAADRLVKSPGFAQNYVGLALRAQSNCRTSLATMAKVHRTLQQAQDGDGA